MVQGKMTHEYYARSHDWKEEEIGIDLPTLLYWLVDCLVVHKMSIRQTERYIHMYVLEDLWSTLSIVPCIGNPSVVSVTYYADLNRKPGFTCLIGELPLMKRWVDKSRRDSDVEEKK